MSDKKMISEKTVQELSVDIRQLGKQKPTKINLKKMVLLMKLRNG